MALPPLARRSNEQWVEDLSVHGPRREEALAQLRALLIKGLRHAVSHYPGSDEARIEDCVQLALVKILAALHSFRGASRFTTWAQSIAVHVALTELRRVRWSEVSLDEIESCAHFVPESFVDPKAPLERRIIQRNILESVRRAIAEDLTQKQRLVLIAEEQGISLAELAHKTGSSRNALYKRLHDARQRLKECLLATGISPEDIRSAFDF